MATAAPRPRSNPSPAAVLAAQERETRLVREAIAMVASGASTRVVVAGIRYGEALLDSARRMALEAGVRATPIWKSDNTGADIAIEAIYK